MNERTSILFAVIWACHYSDIRSSGGELYIIFIYPKSIIILYFILIVFTSVSTYIIYAYTLVNCLVYNIVLKAI